MCSLWLNKIRELQQPRVRLICAFLFLSLVMNHQLLTSLTPLYTAVLHSAWLRCRWCVPLRGIESPVCDATSHLVSFCFLDSLQFCTLLGYGADGVCPYLAFEALFAMQRDGGLLAGTERKAVVDGFMKGINVGILKVGVDWLYGGTHGYSELCAFVMVST